MLGELTPCGGGAPIPLFLRRLLVGRAAGCDVVIPSRSVSSRHCELRYNDRVWHVCDLDSRNGTAVNGVRCDEAELMPEDVISFSRERYVIHYARSDVPVTSGTSARPAAAAAPGIPSGSRPPQATAPARKSALLGRLVPCGGGDPIPLIKPRLLVGRRGHCDIQLKFRTVSSEHCRLEFKQGFWFVEELKTTNGVKVDGTRCAVSLLKPDCVLSIANIRYRIHYDPPEGDLPEEAQPFSIGLLEKAGIVKRSGGKSKMNWQPPPDDEDKPKRYSLDD